MNTNERNIGRRQFLVVSSTCAVAAVVAPKLFGGTPAVQPKRLAVGFSSHEENAALMAASGVPAGDGGFISRGARITVAGASGASVDPRGRRATELRAHYSYLDGSERRDAPFLAWGCSRVTGCQGNAVSFNVPVDEVQRIRFTVGVESGTAATAAATTRRNAFNRDADPPDAKALPVALSLLSEPDSLKLVRGYYVIVPLFENDGEPRWSNWRVARADGRMALVDSSGNVAPFEHFVLRIDYAS